MPQGNPFSTSYRSSMGSNATTGQNQGGGSKKAGLAPSVGKDSWMSIHIQSCDPLNGKCCDRTKMSQLRFTQPVSQSRPIGSRGNVSYWKVV